MDKSNAKEMNWISVKDRLPSLYEKVLVYTDKCIYESYAYDFNACWRRIYPDDEEEYKGIRINWTATGTVTHWMPLPEKPE